MSVVTPGIMSAARDAAAGRWHGLIGSERLVLLSDLDGTLIPFAPTAAQAALDDEAAGLLRELTTVGVQVVIVSGRPRRLVDGLRARVPNAWWFAEHGAWRCVDGGWRGAVTRPPALGQLDRALLAAIGTVDGARLEHKTAGLCVHWRQVAEPQRAALIAAVERTIAAWLAAAPGYERLAGVEMIEVRPRGLHKGTAVAWVRGRLSDARLIAIGDDVTDEDMFRALSDQDLAISVGRPLDRRTHAQVSVASVGGARRFLRWLAEARASRAAVPPAHAAECAVIPWI